MLDQPDGGGQRGPDRGEPATGLARVPPADGDRDRAGERLGGLGPAGRPGRRPPCPPPSPGSSSPCGCPPGRAASRCCAATRCPARRGRARTGSASSASRTGLASQYIHTRLRAGDQVEVAAPRGTFLLQPGTAPVLLISAGVGATPVLAMLHALAAERSSRDIWWLHGARSRAAEPFAAESRSLLAGLARGHRHICYSHPGPADVAGDDYQTAGRLTPDVLAGLDLPRDADAYLCGPAGFMDRHVRRAGQPGHRRPPGAHRDLRPPRRRPPPASRPSRPGRRTRRPARRVTARRWRSPAAG